MCKICSDGSIPLTMAVVTATVNSTPQGLDMRRATKDTGWLIQPGGTEPYGFSLGFDFCAEHEAGTPYLKAALGIVQKHIPIGVEDRTVTKVPQELQFFEHEAGVRDKRVKKTMPAALLYCCDVFDYSSAPVDLRERALKLGVGFDVDFTDPKWYDPAKHDVVVAWSGHSGFAVHVRGEANVQRLKTLFEAFKECRVSLADASNQAFSRKALALVMNKRLSPEMLSTVREKDLEYLRLHQAKDATGVETLLREKGKRWHALSPAWREGEGSELIYFLNPWEQKKYAYGWFTTEELRQWAHDSGPVVDHNAIEALVKMQDVDWAYHLRAGLHEAGVVQRVFESFVWMDEAKTQAGVRLLLSTASQSVLSEGIHSLASLEHFVVRGRELHEEERLRHERSKQAASVSTSA